MITVNVIAAPAMRMVASSLVKTESNIHLKRLKRSDRIVRLLADKHIAGPPNRFDEFRFFGVIAQFLA